MGEGFIGGFKPTAVAGHCAFLCRPVLALRSGQEHRRLRHHPSPITLVEPEGGVAYLWYQEDTSKTNQGGLKHRKKVPKELIHKENT